METHVRKVTRVWLLYFEVKMKWKIIPGTVWWITSRNRVSN